MSKMSQEEFENRVKLFAPNIDSVCGHGGWKNSKKVIVPTMLSVYLKPIGEDLNSFHFPSLTRYPYSERNLTLLACQLPKRINELFKQ